MKKKSIFAFTASFALLGLIHFEFAAPHYIDSKLGGKTFAFPNQGDPSVNRRCMESEKKMCVDACGELGGISPHGKPWNPFQPTTLLTVSSCEVVTVGGVLSTVCKCEDPGLRASLEVEQSCGG